MLAETPRLEHDMLTGLVAETHTPTDTMHHIVSILIGTVVAKTFVTTRVAPRHEKE